MGSTQLSGKSVLVALAVGLSPTLMRTPSFVPLTTPIAQTLTQ
jgi:hypothetical protein